MNLTSENLAYLSQCAIVAAKQAGELIAGYADENIDVQSKAGGDSFASQVVTEVDLRSEAIIVETLQPACDEFELGLLTEERGDDGSRLVKDYFWCIDPIDGTMSFIDGVPGYAVSIALVSRAGEPIIGVVYYPSSKILYSAIKGQGARRNGEAWTLDRSISPSGKPFSVAIDRSLEVQSYYPALIKTFEAMADRLGSASLKTYHSSGAVMNGCWILENAPGCYFKFPKPRDGGGSLWDFAAISCLFLELGAIATDFHGRPLELNNAETTFMNKRGVLFATDQSLVSHILGLCRKVCEDLN